MARAVMCLAALLAAGCSRDRPCRFAYVDISPGARDQVALLGRPWDAARLLVTGTTCDLDQPLEDLAFETAGPDNLPIAYELSPLRPHVEFSGPFGRVDSAAGLSFTPVMSGPHHFLIDDRATGLLSQFDLMVAQADVQHRVPLPGASTREVEPQANEAAETAVRENHSFNPR